MAASVNPDDAAKEQPLPREPDPRGEGGSADAAESNLWTGRTDWRHYAGRLLLWAGGNVLLAGVLGWAAARFDWGRWGTTWVVVAIVLVSGAWIVGRVALKILGSRYRLTTQRLFIERGLFSQTIDQTELIRVDDVQLRKTFVDRLLGLGTVAILSTDASDRQTLIEGVANPEAVAEAIRSRMRALRKRSLFVESL